LYTKWRNFRDVFLSLVHSNERLTNVERLHYLKTCLVGEASSILKNTAITDANYQSAWNELEERYDNPRAIANAHLRAMLDLTPMKQESASELKRIYSFMKETVRALDHVKPRDYAVAIIARKLDSDTKREWQLSLGNSRELPTYEVFNDFLVGRLRAYEDNDDPQDKMNKSRRIGNAKALNSSVSRHKCVSCGELHALYQCTNFKSLSTGEWKELVKRQRCCYNCLGKGHMTNSCPSLKRCMRCQSKHHSLLHEAKGKNEVKTNDITPVDSTAGSSASEKESKSTLTLKVQTNLSYRAPAPVLLATARVLVRLDQGRSVMLRALIDRLRSHLYIRTNRSISATEKAKNPRSRNWSRRSN